MNPSFQNHINATKTENIHRRERAHAYVRQGQDGSVFAHVFSEARVQCRHKLPVEASHPGVPCIVFKINFNSEMKSPALNFLAGFEICIQF